MHSDMPDMFICDCDWLSPESYHVGTLAVCLNVSIFVDREIQYISIIHTDTQHEKAAFVI